MITAKLDQPTFDRLAEDLRIAENITLTGTGGTIAKAGATVVWSFAEGVLTMKVTHAPFGLTDLAEAKLRQALQARGVTVAAG